MKIKEVMYFYDLLCKDIGKKEPFIQIGSKKYEIRDSILRQIGLYSPNQQQTKDCFGFKWNQRETFESENAKAATKEWLFNKYFNGDILLLEEFLKPEMKMLDAGCGCAYSASLLFGKRLNSIHYLGVDISIAVDVALCRFKEQGIKGEFIQADLTALPFEEPIFDIIFSEGVLHHTDSTEYSLKYLAKLLKEGGRFLFYIYKKKGPLREFSDDYIRDYLKELNDQQAWDALIPLTKLGKELGELNIEINVSEAIPYLGIPAGTINLQRLIYYYMFKAFYRPEYTIDEMNHINYDWYRPLNCHRHNEKEITTWCNDVGLKIERMYVEDSGISVIAKKI